VTAVGRHHRLPGRGGRRLYGRTGAAARGGHPLAPGDPPAGGPGGRLHALELPGQPAGAQAGQRAGRRLQRGAQARRGNAGHRHADRALPSSTPACRPRRSTWSAATRLQVSATLIDHPAIARCRSPARWPVGQLLAEQRRAPRQALHRRTGRPCAGDRVRRCRPGLRAEARVAAKFRNAGQVCASPIRFYVHRALHARLRRRLRRRRAGAAPGRRGSTPQTQMGPLTHARRLDDMDRFVDDAVAAGARCCAAAPGRPPGLLLRPTVLADAPATAA
jgi:hypothetical protein